MLTATNRSKIKISKEIELKRFSEKTSKLIKKFKTIFLYGELGVGKTCLLYTSPSPRDPKTSRMPSSA